MTATDQTVWDPHDVRLASDVPEVLVPFNLAGVLGPAEVHGARTLGALVGDDRPEILLAAALALRAPQHGHVCIELPTVADTVTAPEDAPVPLTDLVRPDPTAWRDILADSPLVKVRPAGTPNVDPKEDRPLSLVEDRLYLDRYWRYERRVAHVLRNRAERLDEDVDPEQVRDLLDRLLPPERERPDRQRLAVASGALRALTVISGGPGTGKTHTVARLLALLHELREGHPPRVAVAAPTGKAADRLTAALRKAAEDLDTTDEVKGRLRELEGSTLHRLLGWNPSSATRFRHDREHKLPHGVVIVDETSMVDLPLMAKLVVALRPEAKLVLVGDPDQLASVEAGAVLSDIVGPMGEELRMSSEAREMLEVATGEPLEKVAAATGEGIHDAVIVLGTVRRYPPGSGIARLATAINDGDEDATVAALRAGTADVTWIEGPGDGSDPSALGPVRELVVGAGQEVFGAAWAGDGKAALDALDRVRVLCAHRRGPVGVAGWVPLVEGWLAEDVDGFDPSTRWYVGQPVLITRNEPRLHLYNGDVGVVIRSGTEVTVAFRGPRGVRTFAPTRLEDVETVHAMTIHKSQGSQFKQVVVVLPEADSQILTRELLYTAVTRAEKAVTIVGTEAAVRAAVARRVSRASGLRETLWGRAD